MICLSKKKEIYSKCNPELNKEYYHKELNVIFAPYEKVNKNHINYALWVYHSLPKNYEKNIYKRIVFFFTDNDDQIKNDFQGKEHIFSKIKRYDDRILFLCINSTHKF